jgi:2-oxoglutarate dehydrogenase E2 component (dihydrolipoamide succinyltransferase)
MSLVIKVPTVGESITEVTIAQWFKKEGDSVEMDEIICELESDKATFELNAEAAGVLHIKAEEGDTLEIGATICEIDTDQASAVKETPTPMTETNTPSSTGEIKEMIVPTVGESITEVTISSWLKAEGDFVALDEIIAEFDSDKATFELPAEANGILRIVAQEDATIEIGALILSVICGCANGVQ